MNGRQDKIQNHESRSHLTCIRNIVLFIIVVYSGWRFWFICYVSQCPHGTACTLKNYLAGVSIQYNQASWSWCVDLDESAFVCVFICSYILMEMIEKIHSIFFHWNWFYCSTDVITYKQLSRPTNALLYGFSLGNIMLLITSAASANDTNLIEYCNCNTYSKFKYRTNLIYNIVQVIRVFETRFKWIQDQTHLPVNQLQVIHRENSPNP